MMTLSAIQILAAAAAQIREQSADAYPHECCGALLGEGQTVLGILALPNATDEGPRRFLVRPADYLAAERRASELGCQLIGFYHSHPDAQARPSQYDLDHAWPNLSYVITAVNGGAAGDMTSWRLREDRTRFEPEELTIVMDSVFTCPRALTTELTEITGKKK